MKKWTIDNSHTDVSFKVKHMGIMNVRGSFTDVEGTVSLDDNNALHSVEVKINTKSISTRDKDRDSHLLEEEFLFAKKHSAITFRSTSIKKNSESQYEVKGKLTIRGITNDCTLVAKFSKPISDPFGLQRMAIEAKTEVNRFDYGIKFNDLLDTGGLLVGKEVGISIDTEIIHK